jgi:hypothetical protein
VFLVLLLSASRKEYGMKKIVIVMLALLNSINGLYAGDQTTVSIGSALQNNPCAPHIVQVVLVAQKVAIAQTEEKKGVNSVKGQVSSCKLMELMRKNAEEAALKESSLPIVYLKAHEQAVKVGDADAAHILAIEKEGSERGWYHSWVSSYPKAVTAIEFAVPAVVSFVVLWLCSGRSDRGSDHYPAHHGKGNGNGSGSAASSGGY